ncbi:MAG TPA: methylated-DNA--[protein]-cysteine S-methyltransferase [Candidatus Limnocylindrales bacterium]|nr:methylated-DNA--[protein]-cysteine S-methyltransferase [Candidatus Limnocylindrales bacterium]
MEHGTGVVSFETELGRCAVRWTDRGIRSVLLPGRTAESAPPIAADADLPPFVRDAVDGITRVMAGQPADLRGIPIDRDDLDEFQRSVYAATREIPAGSTWTYGDVARAVGLDRRDGARDVGAALARNPTPVIVPCHRVVGVNGKLTGFSAPGGLATKRLMLELEGAPGYGQQVLFG